MDVTVNAWTTGLVATAARLLRAVQTSIAVATVRLWTWIPLMDAAVTVMEQGLLTLGLELHVTFLLPAQRRTATAMGPPKILTRPTTASASAGKAGQATHVACLLCVMPRMIAVVTAAPKILTRRMGASASVQMGGLVRVAPSRLLAVLGRTVLTTAPPQTRTAQMAACATATARAPETSGPGQIVLCLLLAVR